MGYWKDHFPGSEAYYLRIRVARIGIAYTVIVGGLLFAFSPLAARIKKDGGQLNDPQWLKDKMAKKMGGNIVSGTLDKTTMEKVLLSKDQADQLDFTRTKKFKKELEKQEP